MITIILATTLALIVSYFICRSTLAIKIDQMLKKRQRKKLASKQTFAEWFFYKRYVDILPKFYLIWYYSLFVQYVIAIVATIIFRSTPEIINRIPLGFLILNSILGSPTLWEHRSKKY